MNFNKVNWQIIFNPFQKFDEKHLLVIGILFFILNIIGCYHYGLSNGSVFHYSILEKPIHFLEVVKSNGLSFLFAIIVLYILGKFLNKRTRFIDIINTVLISQIPLIITTPILGLTLYRETISSLVQNDGSMNHLHLLHLLIFIIWILSALTMLVYSIVLYYNGFRTATNIKNWQHIVVFTITSLIVTLISQLILI